MRIHLVGAFLLVAHVAFADDLHLSVHGNLDRDMLRSRVASELNVVVLIADTTCDLPCLDVTVDAGRATVVYAPKTGASRERTIELGSDAAQWPLVVALLAGNVARDEAADVLAQLPEPTPGIDPAPEVGPPPGEATPPPDAAPAIASGEGPGAGTSAPELAPTPPPDDDRPWSLFGIGFVPVLGTDSVHVGKIRHLVSLDVLVGISGGSSIVTASGIVDIERGPVAGVQLAGITALAPDVAGVQIGGVVALTKHLAGIQVGGIASVAERADGIQVGGVAAVARRADIQVGGVATVSRDSSATLQLAGVAAVAHGNSHLQAGGVASVSRDADLQFAGVVNVARRLRGVQIAPINVAGRNEGVQIGVINVGGGARSTSFGLINIVPGGRYDIEGAVDSNNMETVLFRHGGAGWHNVYGIGAHPVPDSSEDVWMYGLGFGPSFELGRTMRLDVEAIGWEVSHGFRHSDDISILAQLRASLAYGFGPVAVVVGAAINSYISNDQESPLILERRAPGAMDTMSNDVTVETWPSAFVGVRF